MIAYRNNPEELICMFSDALNEMDRNMERYMVEELNQQVSDLKDTVQSQKSTIQSQDDIIQSKDNLIQELQQKLAQYEGKTNK